MQCRKMEEKQIINNVFLFNPHSFIKQTTCKSVRSNFASSARLQESELRWNSYMSIHFLPDFAFGVITSHQHNHTIPRSVWLMMWHCLS